MKKLLKLMRLIVKISKAASEYTSGSAHFPQEPVEVNYEGLIYLILAVAIMCAMIGWVCTLYNGLYGHPSYGI